MPRWDPEMMEHVRERTERIRQQCPEETFDPTTALMIAKREIEPLYSGGSGGTDGN